MSTLSETSGLALEAISEPSEAVEGANPTARPNLYLVPVPDLNAEPIAIGEWVASGVPPQPLAGGQMFPVLVTDSSTEPSNG